MVCPHDLAKINDSKIERVTEMDNKNIYIFFETILNNSEAILPFMFLNKTRFYLTLVRQAHAHHSIRLRNYEKPLQRL